MNPPYVMRRNGMGYASMATHPGPVLRGMRRSAFPVIAPDPAVSPPRRPVFPPWRSEPPEFPSGSGGGGADASKILEGVTFDKDATDFEARETLATLVRRLGGTVVSS